VNRQEAGVEQETSGQEEVRDKGITSAAAEVLLFQLPTTSSPGARPFRRVLSLVHSLELDHAQDIIADIMDTVIRALRPPFRLAKFEGDAAFVLRSPKKLDGSRLQHSIETAYDISDPKRSFDRYV
jgi:hypothetical protein